MIVYFNLFYLPWFYWALGSSPPFGRNTPYHVNLIFVLLVC